MFEYFDGNYSWNMAINLALGMGASIGDIDDASRPLRAVAADNDDAAAELFFARWTGLAGKVQRLAEADEAAGRRFSAGDKYRRAAIYWIQAERMQQPAFAPREGAFRSALACFAKYLDCSGVACRRVEVPYEDTTLPALFVPAAADTDAPAPCMIHFDGLDVTKEIIYMLGMPDALRRRGVATLVVDNPGVGESLRDRKLPNSHAAEKPAAACVDYLEGVDGIDPKRIGIMALSLGGYHAPRAAAFEHRLACAVAWGANYNWGATQQRRYESGEQSLPVPHYWDHVGWVFGKDSVEDILEESAKLTLEGVLHRIECPILVVHGENDRQIKLEQARQTVAECTASPKAELHVHTLADGGAEHCSVDNVRLTIEVMSDWIAGTLGGRTA
jgi:dienelactone hydrolase